MLKSYGGTFIIEGMTAKAEKSKREQIEEIQAAIDYGIDVFMLIQNIERSCTERILRHQIALNTVEKLGKARDA